MTPPPMSCRTNTTNTAVSLLEVRPPHKSLQAARYRWAGALGTRKIMASVPKVGAQLTPHATAVLEHPRKGETWSCMDSFQEVPGLFRAEAGLSHPAPPLLLAPASQPTGWTVTGSPVPRCGGLEKQPLQGFPSSLQKSIGPLGHCT